MFGHLVPSVGDVLRRTEWLKPTLQRPFLVWCSVREGTQGLVLTKQELCHQERHHIFSLSCCFELSSSTGSKNSRLKIKMRSAMPKFTSTSRPWPSKKSAVRGGSQISKPGQFQCVR